MMMVSCSQPAILFHLQNGETTLRLRLATSESLVFFATTIGDLGIVGLLYDYDWWLGNCWVSFALYEYVVILQDQQIVVRMLCRSYTMTDPLTEYGRCLDRAWTFHGHGTDILQTLYGHSAKTAPKIRGLPLGNSAESATEFLSICQTSVIYLWHVP